MKIIAHTDSAYLVEVNEFELNAIAGGNLRDVLGVSQYKSLPAGLSFKVHTAWARLKDLRDRADSLRRSAATMRALAEMLDQQLDVVEMPPAPQPDGDAA